MKKEDQQRTIANEIGWTGVCYSPNEMFLWGHPPGKPEKWKEVPMFPENLNAMHEAEKTLTERQQWNYFYRLAERCGEKFEGGRIKQSTAVMMLGWNAEVKAEEFLRTIGKWKPADSTFPLPIA
jgi:hypothetical protein